MRDTKPSIPMFQILVEQQNCYFDPLSNQAPGNYGFLYGRNGYDKTQPYVRTLADIALLPTVGWKSIRIS